MPDNVERRPSSFPDERLPSGTIMEGQTLANDVEEAFDYVVVGSGSAAAVAALVAARALGVPPRGMQRHERGCRGTARCLTGCPTGAKQAMNVTYVPWALALGAHIIFSCRFERVLIERGVATGVVAWTTAGGPATRSARRVTLHPRRAVIVAASTVQSPHLLRPTGLRARAPGRHFQCHPC